MSFTNLMSGAECATGSNPLLQFSKHVERDNSLQQDKFVTTGTLAGMRGHVGMSIQDRQMAERFFGNEQTRGKVFEFERMRHELEGVHRQSPSPMVHGGARQEWLSDFRRSGSATPAQAVNQLLPEEQMRMENAFSNIIPNSNAAWQNEFIHRPPHAVFQHFHTMPAEFDAAFMRNFPWSDFTLHNPGMLVTEKGKGKMVELDDKNWEQEFRQLEDSIRDEEAKAAIDNELNEQESQQFFGDFESIWNGIRAEEVDNMTQADWEADYRRFAEEYTNTDIYDGKPDLGDYMFEPNNPYMDHVDPFLEGMRLLNVGGSLSEAVLAFEAACQREPERLQAWTQLGIVQAQNEKEIAAIRALEHAIRQDESNLSALMSLAVSYTNEGHDTAAYLTLEQWVQTKYPVLATTQNPAASSNSRREIHKRVTDLFIRAAQFNPEGREFDADVQVGLGVLFYGDEEYDMAVDCFTAALNHAPNDHLLWNRLGATLANSGKSEEAIDAYHRALDLRPTFVRAKYNLGVSCINIGCYHQAAEHLLGALAMHQVEGDSGGGVNISSNLWETLRRTFLCLERRDLAEKAESGADVNIFRNGEFDF